VPFEIKRESPSSTVIDGNWGFRYVVSEKTMELTIDKAKNNSVAAATVLRQGHVERVDQPNRLHLSGYEKLGLERILSPLLYQAILKVHFSLPWPQAPSPLEK
jgi:hypothetical protein